MKNIANLIFLGLFTTAVTLGFIDVPQQEDLPLDPSFSVTEQVDTSVNFEETEYLNGVFVTTVYNLDFPSTQSLSESQLKAEIDDILNNVQDAGLSDIFFQVRPCADAFYYSDIFPTSIYLTGNQNTTATFDVLEYYINGCHERGLSLHAWVNPYRITKSSSDVLSSSHIAVTNPELTVLHTDGNLYFDPALEQAQEVILSGIEEILVNYDVDGIHFDDYFYPSTTFNDADSFAKYGNGRSLDDFRRDNITDLIASVDALVEKISPDVSFGVSPSGIWANATDISGGSATNGTGSYENHYADTKKWVEMEIIDYIAPQIYWNFGFEVAEYQTLVDWWSNVCEDYDVDLYICHASYKEYDGTFEAGEIDRQVEYNQQIETVDGSIFFRYKHILD